LVDFGNVQSYSGQVCSRIDCGGATRLISTVPALLSSFNRAACRPASGTGFFSSLVEYKACGPAVVGDFEITFGGCLLRKSGQNVTLSTTVGASNSISAILNQTFSGTSSFSGDAIEIGLPDPNYRAGSDTSFNLFIGDFVSSTYASINLRTDGRTIRSLSAQDFSRNNVISCGR
jgi:hypothetical protein